MHQAVTDHAPIAVGTRVSTILYNRGEGFVFAVHGEQSPQSVRSLHRSVGMSGGRAEFDIVFFSGGLSLRLPECILRGVQWRVLERPGAPSEIEAALTHARAIEQQRAAAAAAAECAHQAEIARLRAAPEYAALRQGDDRHGGKLAAANIRTELRRAFPAAKFSVRVTHSGSVNIRWSGDPANEAVEAIVQRHRAGQFDGMEDIYCSSRSPWCEVFGGADYVWCSQKTD